jgi:hygromycin-B 7''-O-kinase
VTSFAAFRAWRTHPASWLPAVQDIAQAHSLPCDAIETFPTGTNLVVALDKSLVLKLFPPPLRHQFLSERLTLARLEGKLSVAIPEIVAEGQRGLWSYLAITRLPGLCGKEVWPTLAEAQKEAVLRELGETIAHVQSQPPGDLAQLEPRWRPFILGQIEGCRARHERLGLPAKFLAGLDALLAQARHTIPLEAEPVILTGEYTPENLLLAEQSGRWRLCGLIDFGDVMAGFREYDLSGPSAFMAAGASGRMRALLRGYGYRDADIDKVLTRRLMLLCLLHRFSDLRNIAIPDCLEKAADLEELERLIWPIELQPAQPPAARPRSL